MSKKVVLHVSHGGGFQRLPYLVYCEGDISEFECDAKKRRVDNTRDNIVAMGYSKRNFKAIYLSKPNLGFEESLVAINNETEVNKLRLLSSILEYVCLYVEHNDETKSNSDDSDAMVDDDFNEYGSDVDDEEAARIIKNKQKLDKDHLADLEALRDEGVEFISGGNVFDGVDAFETNYQDSNDANSPPSSETDEDGNDEIGKGKRRRTTVYSRYKESTTKDGVHLEAGIMFVDKKQSKEAIEDYQMYNRYGLRTVKSDTSKLYLVCKGEGCELTLFALRPQGEKLFQIMNAPIPHSCVPYSFERGMRRISSDRLARKYREKFRLQLSLRLKELRDIVEEKHNCKPSMSTCVRTRAKALASIIGDCSQQFGMIRSSIDMSYNFEEDRKGENPITMVASKPRRQ
ncbi:hypothetical protein Cgig2_014238 [Carnegiea gigantea]|uniref:Transposase MuDR plant domain-containing protein n=1 Tax=Carnegiea gigantea TaxID=171969 RepID=A0A9Q1K0U9_9CARY|nr:hypothetical protein Cgig2_014238 [Carnegiea gigantea]